MRARGTSVQGTLLTQLAAGAHGCAIEKRDDLRERRRGLLDRASGWVFVLAPIRTISTGYRRVNNLATPRTRNGAFRQPLRPAGRRGRLGGSDRAYPTARLTQAVSCSSASRSSGRTRSHPCMVRPPITARVALPAVTRAPASAGSTRTRAPPW